MKAAVSPHDLEILSAYLDRQLKPAEHARLQARLEKETELAAALESLRNTRRMLRSLPRARAPHNFTLTPAMAGIRPAQPAFLPGLRLASVLAAALLVVVLAGDFLGLLAPATSQMDTMPAVAAEVALTSAEETAQAAAPLGMGMGAEPQNKEAETTDAGEELVAMALPPELTPAPNITDTARVGGNDAAPTEDVFTITGETLLAPPAATLPAIPTFTPTASLPPTATLLPPPTALPLPTRTPADFSAPVVEMPPPVAHPDQTHKALTAIEAVLAVVTIVTGLAAIFLRRGPGK